LQTQTAIKTGKPVAQTSVTQTGQIWPSHPCSTTC